MALFYQHNINEHTQAAVWRIEEDEAFFLGKVPLKKNVSHPYKRIQHLAGRYLLPVLFADFPLADIMIADTRKPFLEKEQYHFSISHCGNYAAAIASDRFRVGVDIEWVTPRIQTIATKFLHDTERVFLQNWAHLPKLHLELLTILWSAKEAIYKWYGDGQVNFKEHIQLSGDIRFRPDEWMELPFTFSKKQPVPLQVEARLFNQLALAWVVS